MLNKSFDSFSNGDQATFLLNCKQQGVCTISLDAATTRSDFKLKLELFDVATGRIEANKTLSITNTGDWQKYRTYTLDTEEMAEGTKRLTMTWLSSKGQYTGNVKNISITLSTVNIECSTFNVQRSTFNTYDLQGRKMSDGTLSRGIYIRNGKKIIIR